MSNNRVKCGSCGGYHSSSRIVQRCYVEKALRESVDPMGRRGANILPCGTYRVQVSPKENPYAYAHVRVFTFDSGRWRDRYFLSLEDEGKLVPLNQLADRQFLIHRIFEEGWTGCLMAYTEATGVCGACANRVYEEGEDVPSHDILECIQPLVEGLREWKVGS